MFIRPIDANEISDIIYDVGENTLRVCWIAQIQRCSLMFRTKARCWTSIHSFNLETFIAPLQDTITQKRNRRRDCIMPWLWAHCYMYTKRREAEHHRWLRRIDTETKTEDEVRKAIQSLKNRKVWWNKSRNDQIWRVHVCSYWPAHQAMQRYLDNRQNTKDLEGRYHHSTAEKGRSGRVHKLERHHSLVNPRKSVTKVMMNRMRLAVDEWLRQEQAGFRPGRSWCEQIFTLRKIIEKP